MQSFGFVELIKPEYQTYIITSYYYPPAPFNFETFYNKLSEKSIRIYKINFLKRLFNLSWKNNSNRLFSCR